MAKHLADQRDSARHDNDRNQRRDREQAENEPGGTTGLDLLPGQDRRDRRKREQDQGDFERTIQVEQDGDRDRNQRHDHIHGDERAREQAGIRQAKPYLPVTCLERNAEDHQRHAEVHSEMHELRGFHGPGSRLTQRNPMWLVDVSTGCAWRAAGR